MSGLVTLDDIDPSTWGPMVDAAARKLAGRLLGETEHWRVIANDVLSAALDLDPKDTIRMLRIYESERAS